MPNKKPVSYLAGAMVVGTAIGALVGMLVAPKSGRDTRQQIKTRAGEAPKYLASELKALPERSREAIKQIPDRLAKLRQGRQDATDRPPVPGTGELKELADEDRES